jgi:hypothetical protein
MNILKCKDCGWKGNVTDWGYIGRCKCGSYNVIVNKKEERKSNQ